MLINFLFFSVSDPENDYYLLGIVKLRYLIAEKMTIDSKRRRRRRKKYDTIDGKKENIQMKI